MFNIFPLQLPLQFADLKKQVNLSIFDSRWWKKKKKIDSFIPYLACFSSIQVSPEGKRVNKADKENKHSAHMYSIVHMYIVQLYMYTHKQECTEVATLISITADICIFAFFFNRTLTQSHICKDHSIVLYDIVLYFNV